jgi:hypothetical protein
MVFPWIPYLQKRAGGKLSDIEFLSIKEFGSKRNDADNTVTITNSTTETTVVTQTATSGKDMYLGDANCQFNQLVGRSTVEITLQLYVNGTVVETARFVTSDGGDDGVYQFKTKGVKVAATQIIKITATQGSAVSTRIVTYAGKLVLFEESTGETPQVTSI